MPHRILLIPCLVLFGLAGLATRADACSCMESGPPCQAFWNSEAVFDATVVAMAHLERPPTTGYPLDDTIVTVEVHAGYKGASAGPLQITTRSQSSACGYPFKLGERYLMFARRAADGRLSVSLCSATRAFDGTGPVAAFLASLAKPPAGGRVFGNVHTSLDSIAGAPRREPLATRVELHGPTGVMTTRSAGGLFEFTGLSVGPYRLEVTAPEGYSGSYADRGQIAKRQAEITDLRGCAEANFTFSPAGQVSGWLVDASGRPLRQVRVELTDVDTKPHPDYGLLLRSTTTDADGAFKLEGVSPGRYIVGVNLNDLPNENNPYARTLYPGGGQPPHVVELTLGQGVDLGIWTMPPPLPLLQLRQGRVYTFMVRDGSGPALRIDAPTIDTSSGAPPSIRVVVR